MHLIDTNRYIGRGGHTLTMKQWKKVIAYEVYHRDKLIFVSSSDKKIKDLI